VPVNGTCGEGKARRQPLGQPLRRAGMRNLRRTHPSGRGGFDVFPPRRILSLLTAER